MRSEGRPIFLDLADRIADDVLSGSYPEESQVPSTNELAAFYRINPATAGKALNRLVDAGVLYKRRGLGMFVATGAPERLRASRRAEFAVDYVEPVVAEARRLGLAAAEVTELVEAAFTTPASSPSSPSPLAHPQELE